MAEAQTTIAGNLAGDPELRFTASGRAVCNFTVAQNRRKRNAAGEWADDAPLWMRCTAWGDLGTNLAESLSKGDRVLVHGRLTPRTFEVEGQTRHVIELTAEEVAASLLFSVVKTTRAVKLDESPSPHAAPPADPWAAEGFA